MIKILNRCPICGERLEYNFLMQFTRTYKIKLDGKLSKNFKKNDVCPTECGFISCTNCKFRTDCDLKVEENSKIKIYEQNGVYMLYEDD